jgi:hypothetical protein
MSFLELTSTLRSSPKEMIDPFFQDEYATLVLDDSVPCIQLTLNGVPRYSEHYHFVQQKRMELMHREIKNYPKLHMLTDSRTASPVLDEDVHYFKTTIMPQMENAGIRYLAIVTPASKYTQLTIREMTQNTRVMTTRYFETIREAKSWPTITSMAKWLVILSGGPNGC